jgi:hypothetical protein
MLDIVIKNTILSGLIIMVVHFMIKNELEDKNTRNKIDTFLQPLINPIYAPVHDELATFFLEATKARSEDNSSACQTKKADSDSTQLKDLYDYVYADNDNSPNELASLYNEVLRTDCIKNTKKTIKCDINADNKRMCRNPIDEHIDKQQKMEAPLIERPDTGFRFGTRVKDYQNETVMNGAFIDGTRMTGFDSNDRLFATPM